MAICGLRDQRDLAGGVAGHDLAAGAARAALKIIAPAGRHGPGRSIAGGSASGGRTVRNLHTISISSAYDLHRAFPVLMAGEGVGK